MTIGQSPLPTLHGHPLQPLTSIFDPSQDCSHCSISISMSKHDPSSKWCCCPLLMPNFNDVNIERNQWWQRCCYDALMPIQSCRQIWQPHIWPNLIAPPCSPVAYHPKPPLASATSITPYSILRWRDMNIRSLSIIDFHAVEDWLGEFIVWYVLKIRLHYFCSDDVSRATVFIPT